MVFHNKNTAYLFWMTTLSSLFLGSRKHFRATFPSWWWNPSRTTPKPPSPSSPAFVRRHLKSMGFNFFAAFVSEHNVFDCWKYCIKLFPDWSEFVNKHKSAALLAFQRSFFLKWHIFSYYFYHKINVFFCYSLFTLFMIWVILSLGLLLCLFFTISTELFLRFQCFQLILVCTAFHDPNNVLTASCFFDCAWF